jgi:DNA mismatch endonuclease, patch repair protein
MKQKSLYETDERTSRRMSAVRPKNTTPEKIVRSVLTGLGRRYRLHRLDLPGRPDVVFPVHRKVVLIHGCYWHRHLGCARTTMPCRNVNLWQDKFRRTEARDQHNLRALTSAGWKVLVVWECETANREALARRLTTFLDGI